MSTRSTSSSKSSEIPPDTIAREDRLYQSFLHGREDRPRPVFILIVLAFHALALAVTLPRAPGNIQPVVEKKVIRIREWRPPPPRREKREPGDDDATRKVPVPEVLTPKAPPPPPPPQVLDPDARYMLGPDGKYTLDPDGEYVRLPGGEYVLAEPGSVTDDPLLAGVGGVSMPVLIASSRVDPVYPRLARQAGIEGRVILEVVVLNDGTVGELRVLGSPGEKLGFDEAAMKAVRQWRYMPATQDGRPVTVLLTVVVEFSRK